MENVKKVMDIVDTVMKFESLDEKMARLKRKMDDLRGKGDDINEELKYAESLSMKRRKKEVESWLKNVKRVKIQFRKIKQEVEEGRTKLLPNLQLHRVVHRLTTEVEELYRQGDFSRGLTLEAHETRGLTFPATTLFGQKFQENKNVIWECLRDNNSSIIGVHGMGGVGKTALLTHVNNELVRDCPDTSVSWVTVSQNFTIHKLQDEIAKALHFEFSYEDDVKKRAAELSNFLGTRRNFVLILDDVWDYVPLDEIGIRVFVNGCKLILTTRKLDVCRRMDCQKRIQVIPLSDEESWELFEHKLGVEMELTPEIEDIAKALVKECAGLPLGVITMAGSLKGVDEEFEWKNALENVKQSKFGDDDMEAKVFPVLKHSYDMLKDPKVQQCFLDCSLYPEDLWISGERLINLFIDEGLIDGIKDRQAELNRGHTILNKLVHACLLENSKLEGTMFVKMHDLVRDMALKITSTSPRFLVEADVKLKEIPDEVYWAEDLVKVSLGYNNISNIPPSASPRCPRISTLILGGNESLTSIPDCFFIHMIGLNVLDLSFTAIENLPKSVSNLVNLTALLLRGCRRLKYLPCLANLKALRRLDLSHTRIRELPQGLENLANLRYLNLFVRTSLQMLPGILINLIRLQHLILNCNSKKMRVEGEELARLRRLATLEAPLYHVNDLNTFVSSLEEKELINYKLVVGSNDNEFLGRFGCDKIVVIKESNISESTFEEYPLLLPQGIEHLTIASCQLSRSFCKATSLDQASNLTHCDIVNCDGMENLISVSSAHSYPLLQSLEYLSLDTLQEFCGLFSEERDPSSLPPVGTFSSLKKLYISGCPKMKTLFTAASLSLFQNLESLKVRFCKQMVEIMVAVPNENEEEAGSRGGTTELTLPKLKNLELWDLPELKSFSDGNKTLVVDSLETICITDCPKLTKLSLFDEEMCHLPSLQKIYVTEKWWDSLEWDHPNAKDRLQSFCCFVNGQPAGIRVSGNGKKGLFECCNHF